MANPCFRVLVTDGNNRAALAITRSLGRAGHHVVVAEHRRLALAGASRFCADRVVYPDPAGDEPGFLAALEDAVHHHRIDILLPVADITTWLVSANRVRFEASCRVACSAAAAIERAADKSDVVRTAMRLGVPVPRTVFLERAGELPSIAAQLTFPVVIKPRRSRLRTSAGWRSASVRYAQSLAQLTCEVAGRHQLEFPLLLQECIVGAGSGVFTCFDGGKPVAWFSHRRLREKPPTGGVSVLCESIALRADARIHAERLLSELGWQGVAMVEFKEDQRDGSLKLMEINGRFWGSLQLAVDAGVDFPVILLSSLSGMADRPIPGYRVGVRSRWLCGDIDSLLITLRTGGRMRALLDFLRLWGRDLHYENPRWSDLRPWLRETSQWVRNSAG